MFSLMFASFLIYLYVVVVPSESPTETIRGGSSPSVGAVVGPVIAVLLLVAVIAAVIFWKR